MVVVAAFAGLPHVDLRVARKLIANEHPARIASETPRVILKRAEIVTIEGVRSVLTGEHRVLEFGRAVFLGEKETERVFGIAGAPAVAAANPQAAIDLETFCAIGINQIGRASCRERV